VEIGHERLDVFMTTVRLVQRVLEQHVRRGDLIDDAEVALLTPETPEPAAYDRLRQVRLLADPDRQRSRIAPLGTNDIDRRVPPAIRFLRINSGDLFRCSGRKPASISTARNGSKRPIDRSIVISMSTACVVFDDMFRRTPVRSNE
jgi:hypothetical protein